VREFGGELWGLVGLVVDVIRRGVELDSSENGDGFNLEEISRDQLVPRMPAKSLGTLEVADAASEKYRVPMEAILKMGAMDNRAEETR
jgi:hypothetical protein